MLSRACLRLLGFNVLIAGSTSLLVHTSDPYPIALILSRVSSRYRLFLPPSPSSAHIHTLSYICHHRLLCSSSGMPSYCLQDCHYFYRTALRGLNISTSVSPLYA